MANKNKRTTVNKTVLTAEQKKQGKNHVYILLGMIAIGLAIAFYSMHM